ncbi:MAG: hypothetical protein K0Q91_1037 [Fibrobacteria bacterium]|jgi:hypothetical protein|nr:hypothetical protein [Fibrobacteria bacterium]
MYRRYKAASRLNQTVHSLSFAARSSALAAALFLSACDFFLSDPGTEAPGESGLSSPWIGKSLDSLGEVAAIAVRDGRLFVANRHAAAPGVAAVDTATGLITEYYPEIVAPSSLAFTSAGHLIVTETSFNYMEGSVSVINVPAKKIRKSVITFGSDNGAVAGEDGRVYLFDRTTGAVTGFTGNEPGAGVAFDVQTGAGSNPYDIAVTNGKAYIPRYNSKSLLILDATLLGGGVRDSIDLSAYSKDTATLAPRMASVTAHGGYVFVTLQRLRANYSANDTSLVVVINASTKVIEKTIALRFRNPVATAAQGDFLYVTGIAGYGDQLGGVERINLSTRQHAGTVITEAALAADVFDFVPAGNGTGYVAYSTDFGVHTRLKKTPSAAVAKVAP